MPEEETEQRFVVIVKNFGDPEKLKDTILRSLGSCLHYTFMPGCLIVDGAGRVHRFLPEPEMGRHHTEVIGSMDWAIETSLNYNPELVLKTCPDSRTGRHCYHHEDDPENTPCCYEQPEAPVENTWQA
jgi:hypothetical protein